MSHRATAWAFQQRGLKPATWRVLVQLADRHNGDTSRCDPSQAQLAHDCEISPSTLNVHLEILEGRGLIRRIRRSNKATGHQERTYYILGCDFDTAQEPTPESGDGETAEPTPDSGDSRLRNPETNLVNEPGNTACAPAREAAPGRAPGRPAPTDGGCARRTGDGPGNGAAAERLLAVAGPGLCAESRRRLLAEGVAVIRRWLRDDLDLEADLVPVVEKRTRIARGSMIRTWEYFTPAVKAHQARRLAQAARQAVASRRPAGPVAGDPLERLAGWINSGAHVPPSAVSNSQRDALLARGMVTADRLRQLQIY